MIYLFGLIPASFAILALMKNKYLFKALVTSSILLFCLFYMLTNDIDLSFTVILAAFLFSIIGDYFLTFKEKHQSYYVIGISIFFLAHVSYLAFMLVNGSLSLIILVCLVTVFFLYFILRLYPTIKDRKLLVSVLLYLAISCVTYAASFGLDINLPSKILIIAAISLIVISDITIAETDFVKNRKTGVFILPTYYLAHLCLLYSIFFL